MRIPIVALLVLFVVDAARAQRRHAPFAERGDLAAFVSVQGLSSLRIDQALGGVGVRYRLADQTVFGTSLGFGVNENDREEEGDRVDGGSTFGQRGATVSLWVEQHVGRRSRLLSPLVGAGLRVRTSQVESDRVTLGYPCGSPAVCDAVEVVERYEAGEVGVGGALFLGAEVRVVRGVTLGAAYGVGIEYSRRDQDIERVDSRTEIDLTSREEEERVAAGTGVSSFFLSVYF